MSLFCSVYYCYVCTCACVRVCVALFEAVTKSHTHALSTAFSGQFLFSLLSMLAFCASLVCEFIETRKCPAVPCTWVAKMRQQQTRLPYPVIGILSCTFTIYRFSFSRTHTQSPRHTHVAHINIENAS